MQQVGPYHIPFPYVPYPLQEHAMTALREFLEDSTPRKPSAQTQSNADEAVRTTTQREASSSTATPSRVRSTNAVLSSKHNGINNVVVLESPTGTGKSQMLLNSVLSYLFDPVYPSHATTDVRGYGENSTDTAVQSKEEEKAAQFEEAADTVSSKPRQTLEEILKQRQLEEEMDQLRRERTARVRAQRRQLRKARHLMRLQQQQQQHQKGDKDAGNEFLLAQDPVAWYTEQQQQHQTLTGFSPSRSSSLSSDTSSLVSSASSSSDEDGAAEDAEEALEADLATLIPLRKPKVYLASRTHTQLQQLMDDLRRTAFAQYPLRPRIVDSPAHSSESSLNKKQLETTSTRRLTAVHVAGRQHLCLNARLLRKANNGGGGSAGEMLNHYCREAMQYERSRQGRADRRRRQQQARQQGTSSPSGSTLQNDSAKNSFVKLQDGGVRDMEDVDSLPPFRTRAGDTTHARSGAVREEDEDEDKGCAYCAEAHLRAFMTFLLDEQKQQRKQNDSARECNEASGLPQHDEAPHDAIYTMDRLRHLGEELQACPYLATRLLLRGADVALIPYSYLLDEGQRTALLGGVVTNPATAAEAEEVNRQAGPPFASSCQAATDASSMEFDQGDTLQVKNAGGQDFRTEVDATWSAPATSLGAVLYHRRQRVTATAAFQQRRKQQQQQQQQEAEKAKSHAPRSKNKSSFLTTENVEGGLQKFEGDEGHDDDALWHIMAHSSPPSFRGDILIFDEAHNIADHCRTTSTVSLEAWHLKLAEALCEVYLSRYSSRLLTRNKQRLRELIRFLGKLAHFSTHATAQSYHAGATPTAVSAEKMIANGSSDGGGAEVFAFHTFLFEAGIDNFDVYSLLLFLVDSQLLIKLQGFVGYCLEKEKADAETVEWTGHQNPLTAAAHQVSHLDPLVEPVGVKRRRANKSVADRPLTEHQRQRQFLASLSTDINNSVHPAVSPSPSDVSAHPPLSLTALLQAHADREGSGGTILDPTRQRAAAAEALQRVERFLSMLYVSDSVSTRVIWTPPLPVTSTPTNLFDAHLPLSSQASTPARVLPPPLLNSAGAGGTLKLIQLEPGTHTFAPLAREARAVVLAGGTMQPLAFTCGPLIPACSNQDERKETHNAAATELVSGEATMKIDEGHVMGLLGVGDRAGTAARGVRESAAAGLSARPAPPCESATSVAPKNVISSAVSVSASTSSNNHDMSVLLPVRLISEGHVVPPSSVRVFTLGTGPSGVRLEFTQQALSGRGASKATLSNALNGHMESSNGMSAKGRDGTGSGVERPADRMLAELACTLLNLVRVLPPAGVICFFTSYDVMDRVVAALHSTGYYAQINEVKKIFCETRSGKPKRHGGQASSSNGSGLRVEDLLLQYQNWIYDIQSKESSSPSSSHVDALDKAPEKKKAAKKVARRGALLFAVMGGRLSEGINFADDLGRAVIVLGMPYANPTDVELQMNLHHIAATRLHSGSNSAGEQPYSSNTTPSKVRPALWPQGEAAAGAERDNINNNNNKRSSIEAGSGTLGFSSAAEWGLYMDGMMRSVNQCIGRCIRHAGDYATILLLDARYGERADVRRRVSAWLQPSLQVCRTFGECFAGVRNFFAERRASQNTAAALS